MIWIVTGVCILIAIVLLVWREFWTDKKITFWLQNNKAPETKKQEETKSTPLSGEKKDEGPK